MDNITPEKTTAAERAAINNYTRCGGNERNGWVMLADILRRFDDANLPAALVYWGFARPASADKLAAELRA